MYGGCVLRPIGNEVIERRQPHLLSLKLGFYTVPTGNRTPGQYKNMSVSISHGTFCRRLASTDIDDTYILCPRFVNASCSSNHDIVVLMVD